MTNATASLPTGEHVVTFYESDEGLAGDVARFLVAGVYADEGAVVVATPEHRRAIEAQLGARGVPVADLTAAGRFVWADAAGTLASLTDGGELDRERFRREVGGIVAVAAESGRPVRAFGEMVGLLWELGDVAAAIELETFWNELCGEQGLALFCAYPAASLAGADLSLIDGVCRQHSEVLPPACYAADGAGVDEATTSRSRLFLPMPVAARAVRRFVGETVEAWGAGALFDDATLVASELTTNVVRHASSPFRVTLSRKDDGVVIAVHDTSPAAPLARESNTEAVNGRGLAIVARLSARWGSESRADGKVVWAKLALPPA